MTAVFAFVSAAWLWLLIALLVGGASLIVYLVTRDGKVPPKSMVSIFMAPAVVVFGVASAFASVRQVQAGEAGIVLRYGQIYGQPLAPGLHGVVPFIDRVVPISTRVKTYETGPAPDKSKADYTDVTVDSQTSDGQLIDIAYSLKFQIPEANVAHVYANIGAMQSVVESVVKDSRSIVRILSKLYSADDLYSKDGVMSYNDDLRQAVREDFAKYGFGVTLVDILVREITFSPEYAASVEQKQIAEQQAQQARYVVEQRKQEAEQARQVAQGQADAAVIAAKGQADARVIAAQAEAQSIKLKGDALKANPLVLQLEFVQNLPDKTVFLPSDSVTPFLPISTPTP